MPALFCLNFFTWDLGDPISGELSHHIGKELFILLLRQAFNLFEIQGSTQAWTNHDLVCFFWLKNCQFWSLVQIDTKPAQLARRPHFCINLFIQMFLSALKKAVHFDWIEVCRPEKWDNREIVVFQSLLWGVSLNKLLHRVLARVFGLSYGA